jgi:ADP-ribose pyrophosphatase YjhB (NUDIX family)
MVSLNIPESFGMIVTDKAMNTLIVEQYGQSWSFPKGKLEPGETGLQCASREFREETGYTGDKDTSRLSFITDPVLRLGGVKEPIATTIVRETFMDGKWTDKEKQITYYLAFTPDLGALDFDMSLRDKAITDIKIIPFEDIADKKKWDTNTYLFAVDVSKDEFVTNKSHGQGWHTRKVHYTMHHKDRQSVFDLVAYSCKRREEANERRQAN